MLVDLSHSNTNPVVEREIPWFVNGVVVGCYQPASVLKNLPGLDKLDNAIFKGKSVRQLGLGQMERHLSLAKTDNGDRDLSGFFVVPDAGAAVLFNTAKDGRNWSANKKLLNVQNAPSLTYIDSGNEQVFFTGKFSNIYFFLYLKFNNTSRTKLTTQRSM